MSKKRESIILSEPDFSKVRRRSHEKLAIYNADTEINPKLLEWATGKKYSIKTFGCQGNVRDSEYMKGYFDNLKMSETDDFAQADIIIFNTCAVRENAENKLYSELGNLKKYYDKNKDLIICVAGCVMQEEKPYAFIKSNFPYVKLIFGTFNINNIYKLLTKVIDSQNRVIEVKSELGDIIENMPTTRYEKYKAFVNIMYGCDKFCTYCIVPFTRGQQRSRRYEDISDEVNDLIKQGYKEVTLVGQNVNSYGLDLSEHEKISFASLLEKVAQTGIERIRFTTSHPFDFNEEVFKIMAKYENIMPNLHLPLQSGSDKVLRAMNRSYNIEQYYHLVDLLRKTVPGVSITTDIIVGFPNETYEDFEKTLEVCKKVRFDSAYTFIFSPREGTIAYKMKNVTEPEEISRRFMMLKETVDNITAEIANEYVGKTVSVLFDKVSKKNKDRISGYDEHNKLVHVPYQEGLIGQIKKVKILESHTFSFIGEIVDE